MFQFSPPGPAKVEDGTGTPPPRNEASGLADAAPKLLRGLLEVFLLESLEQSPKHGYALLKEMGDVFGAQPNRNRLYPLLAKLVTDGYIREMSEESGTRTLYTLTDQGRDALHAYRRLPPAFRHALRRIWSDEAHAHATAPTVEGARTIRVMDAADEGADEGQRARGPTGPRAGDELPYPCEDARVHLEKDPRSGALSLRLTGCPMGAYEYCPECPIYKSVDGLRKLVF